MKCELINMTQAWNKETDFDNADPSNMQDARHI